MSRSRRGVRRRPNRRLSLEGPLESRCLLSGFTGFDPPLDQPDESPPDISTGDESWYNPGFEDFDSLFFGFGFFPSSMQVMGSEPAADARVSGPLRQLTVQFDRPLDPWSLSVADVSLEKRDSDGNFSYAFDPMTDLVEQSLDDSGTRLLVTLPSSVVLEPGTYRIVLNEWSFLMGLDGSLLPNFGTREVVSTFELGSASGVTLADAHSLGVVGPHVERADGELDFEQNPKAVNLYRFELSEGHFWRLGVDVRAERIGSALDSALALFDAQGRLLRTSDIGLGSSLNDPYFYIGLTPGVYYLGVSGSGNLPGQDGGYDPVSGTPELRNVNRLGGAYQLRLVADPADSPTRLVDFQLDRADMFDSTPTGFTLHFDGAVVPTPAAGDVDQFPPGVFLRDDAGQTWLVVLKKVDLGRGRLEYVFTNRLPLGRYSVFVDQASGLRDLAGYEPVAVGGLEHCLGTFEVRTQRGGHQAEDFGSVYPAETTQQHEGTVNLQPGESITYRLVVLVDFSSGVEINHQGGSVRAEFINTRTGSRVSFDFWGEGTSRIPLFFEAGEVLVRVSATGDAATRNHWILDGGSLLQERVDVSGVGQDSALSLRLVPSPTTRAMSSDPAWNMPSGVPSTSGGQLSSGPSGSSHVQTPAQPMGGSGPIVFTPIPTFGTGPTVQSNGGGFGGVTAGSPFEGSGVSYSGGALSIALANLSGSLVGRTIDMDDAEQSLASYDPGSAAIVVAEVTTARMTQAKRGVDRSLRSRESKHDSEATPDGELENPPEGHGVMDPTTLTDLAQGASLELAAGVEAGSSWLDAIRLALASAYDSLAEGRTSSSATDAEVASLDPFSRLRQTQLKDGEGARPTWVDPMTIVLSAAIAIEARRCITRWLGERSGLHALNDGRRGGMTPA